MSLVLIGSDNLAPALQESGWDVLLCGADKSADIVMDGPDPEWSEIDKILRKQAVTVEAVLVCDNIGSRTLCTGLWSCEAPVLFYGVDAPLNFFWQQPYARLFDIAALDQKNQAEQITGCHWLPVAIEPDFYKGNMASHPKPAVCFVGVVNDNIRPKRSALLNKLARAARLEIAGGRGQNWVSTARAVELYQSCQVSINENLFAGVTTRPLEIMASGGCLLTEAAPGQMDTFFIHGQHLYYFNPENLLDNLNELMTNNDLCIRLGRQGREAVFAGHTFARRVEQINQWLGRTPKKPLKAEQALAWEGESLLMAGLRWPRQEPRRLSRALGRLEAAAKVLSDSHTWWLLGLGLAALERWPQCVAALQQAYESGGDEKILPALSLGLAMYENQQPQEAHRFLRQSLDISALPGQAEFHGAAARVLVEAGREFCPGFNMSGFWPGAWTALEHLTRAVALSQGDAAKQGPFLAQLGMLLLRHNAPNQAYDCLRAAARLGVQQAGLSQACQAAGQQGYIL